MSEGLPKSVRDALARQAAQPEGSPGRPDLVRWAGDAHPSPDLLNAYLERSLNDEEIEAVLVHLTGCSECREVVFLASASVEDAEPAFASAATPQANSQPVIARQPKTDEQEGSAIIQRRPKPPKHWWKWAAPALAAVVLVSIGVLDRDNIRDLINPPARETAQTEPAAGQSSTAVKSQERGDRQAQNPLTPAEKVSSTELPPTQKKAPSETNRDLKQREEATKDRGQAEISSKLDEAKGRNEVAARAPEAATSNAVATAKPNAGAQAQGVAPPAQTSVEVTAAAPLVQADNSDLSTSDAMKQSLAKSALPTNGAVGGLVMSAPRREVATHWRLSSDGHVEHTVGPSTWTRVMAAEPVTFHVVKVIGNDVWAGGSDGALFRSSDNGKHWNKIALAGEQGTIAVIRFSTAEQGSVRTTEGTIWTTIDGGQTWSKQ